MTQTLHRTATPNAPGSSPADLDDAMLVALVSDGDLRAFAEIVRRHDRSLRALAARLLLDRSHLDDVMQEAYLKAYRALPGFRGGASLATWLYRITYNACLDHIRRSRVRPPAQASEEQEQAWDGPDPCDVAGMRQDLLEAMAGLDPRSRALVMLVDAQGHPYAEAAELLGVTVGTVASQLHRARAQMRRVLEPAA